MVRFAFAAVLGLAVLGIAVGQDLYDDKYDDIDAHEILANDCMRDHYYKCFMGTAPCITPDAKYFAGNFTEAVVTKCGRCTERQKELFGIIVAWYTENRPDEWEALIVKTLEDAKKKNA